MDIRQFLFSFSGRIGRGDFWLLILTNVAILAIVIIIDRLLKIGVLTAVLGIAAFIGIIVVGLSAMARRLHDRNKSAWYALLFFGVPTVLQGFRNGSDGNTFRIMIFSGGFNSFLDLVCLAISIWMVIELGILSDTAGDNAYGPPPLADKPAAG